MQNLQKFSLQLLQLKVAKKSQFCNPQKFTACWWKESEDSSNEKSRDFLALSTFLLFLITVCWAQIKQVGKRQSRDYWNMMGYTSIDHYHHFWKFYQIGSCMKIFKKSNFHFISHIFIWKQCHLWTIECEKNQKC